MRKLPTGEIGSIALQTLLYGVAQDYAHVSYRCERIPVRF